MYRTNAQIARKVYRALKTPSDESRRTDPILAFHFRGKQDLIMMRCNREPEVSVKGKEQIAGEVKSFAYSEFADCSADDVLFRLKNEITLIELYPRGAVEAKSFHTWGEFTAWLDTLDENGVQISLKLSWASRTPGGAAGRSPSKARTSTSRRTPPSWPWATSRTRSSAPPRPACKPTSGA